MTASHGALYAAFTARDSRFDGLFFVGISTTGIYCRPVCGARRARAEHCAFFPSAAAAEQAGFRPCLLCRPELAPAAPREEAPGLAARAAMLLEDTAGGEQGLEEVAQALGRSSRHLRRVFQEAYGVSPVQYQQTRRLLLAKELLTDSGLSVLEVAMAAGFGSLRRMNALFLKHYRLPPTALRKLASGQPARPHELALTLPYRAPYDWPQLLGFLAGRAIPGVEKVEEGAYLRAVRLVDREGRAHTGWLKVSHLPEKNALRAVLSASLAPVLPQAIARLKRLFDLRCDPGSVAGALRGMEDALPGLFTPGVRLPGCFEPFETAARAILGQQITVKAASTLARRLVERLGAPVDTGVPGLTRTFPEPKDLLALGGDAQDILGQLGIISARGRCLVSLAREMAEGRVRLEPPAQPEEEMQKLLGIKGIGPWTAQYILMRTLGYPDAFLETDAGVKQALPGRTAREMLALAEAWRPYRSYAVMNLWNSLQAGGERGI